MGVLVYITKQPLQKGLETEVKVEIYRFGHTMCHFLVFNLTTNMTPDPGSHVF